MRAGLLATMVGALLALLLLAGGAEAKGGHQKKLADLNVRFADGPQAAFAGHQIKVTDSVRNLGNKKARKSKVSYLLSKDDKPSGKDIQLKGRRAIGKLDAGARDKGNAMVRVPEDAESGNYKLIACADGGEKVKESDESNNCQSDDGKLKLEASAPVLTPDPTELDFGSVDLGPTTTEQITITNTGSVATQSLQVVFQSGGGDSLSMYAPPPLGGCDGAVLQPDESCEIPMTFQPTETGSFDINVFVQSGDSIDNGPVVNVPVTGTATEPPVPITPLFYEYPETAVGSSNSNDFTLTNNSGATADVGTIAITGPNAADFELIEAEPCASLPIQPGGTCEFGVKFTPSASGLRTATIVAEGNFGTSYDTISGFAGDGG